MKTLSLLLLALLANIFPLYPQVTESKPYQGQMDKVEMKQITLYKTSDSTKRGISRGDATQLLISTFGQTFRKDREAGSYKDQVIGYYIYEGATFGFTAKKTIEEFFITSSDYYVHVGKHKISVGDNINILSKYFPISYKNQSPSENGYDGHINLYVMGYGLLNFSYDHQTTQIRRIALSKSN